MLQTQHFIKRANQRGINKNLIETTFLYGEYSGDKILLSRKKIKSILEREKPEREIKIIY